MKKVAPFALGAALAITALAGGSARAYTLSLGPNLDPPQQMPVISNSVTCAQAHVPAQVKNAPDYDAPEIAKLQGVQGVSMVKVQLDANNTLQNDTLAKSSGSLLLDTVALNESQKVEYASEVQNCRRVSGTYLLAVAFDSM